MIDIEVISRGGEPRRIEAADGETLMEALRNNGIDELAALCGGCCSCATCHVYIVEGPAGLCEAASDAENDLLDCSDHREAMSRLSCQIRLDTALAGLVVRIAPEE